MIDKYIWDISLIVINYNPENYIWDISLILGIGQHTKKLWKITLFYGNIHYTWPFSIYVKLPWLLGVINQLITGGHHPVGKLLLWIPSGND